MREDNYRFSFNYDLDVCENLRGCMAEVIENAVEQAPVAAAEEVPPIHRKVNWRT